ncbi:MAG TPA: flavodoxin domain-containing protein [Marmoricola sp.]|jgi:menaquinone-dependent protoporphyrinogen oxidase
MGRNGEPTTVLVGYASRHGATAGIARRIAATLTGLGEPATACALTEVSDPESFDAFVIGGAAYYGHWLEPVEEFVRDHLDLLAARPVWFFSSGPLSREPVDASQPDEREASRPPELTELALEVGARGGRVFYGALDPHRLTLRERALRWLPGGRRMLPAGDFRDWPDIEGWATEIAGQLPRSAP